MAVSMNPVIVVGAGPTGNRAVSAATVREIQFGFEAGKIQFSVDVDGPCRLWLQDPSRPNSRYIVIAAEEGWTGEARCSSIWVQGDTGDTNIDVVAFELRGS